MKPFLVVLLLCPGLVLAQAPQLLGYQGRLVKTDGTPESGNAQMRFGLFGTETGGSALWEETQAVAISQGYYSTYLGRMTMFPATLFDTGTLWLEVSVQAPGDTQFRTMTPRQRVGAVAFALSARSLKGGTVDATSVSINGSTVIDSSGKLTASAGYTAGPGISIDGTTRAISINSSGCTTGQVLQWSGSAWQCSTVGGGTGGGLSSVTGTGAITVMNGTTAPVVSVTTGTTAGTVAAGDDARFGNATFLAGRPVAAAVPDAGDVLTWSGSSWVPQPRAVSGLAPIQVTGGSSPVISVNVGTAAGTVAAGNDPRFGALAGRPVATSAPTIGQTLTWNGTAWAPSSPSSTSFPTSPRVLMGSSHTACQPDYGGSGAIGQQNFAYGFIDFPANFSTTPSVVVGIDESLNNSGASWVRARRGPFANRMGVRCDYATNAVHWFGIERGDHVVDGKRIVAGRLSSAAPTNTVFFPSAFSAPPVVLVMIDESGDDNGAIHARVYNVTNNGFQINLVNTTADGLLWIALDPGTYRVGPYRFVAGAHTTGGCFDRCPVALSGFTTSPGVVLTIHDTNNNGAIVHRLFSVDPTEFRFGTWVWDPTGLTPAATEVVNYLAFETLQ